MHTPGAGVIVGYVKITINHIYVFIPGTTYIVWACVYARGVSCSAFCSVLYRVVPRKSMKYSV